VSFWVPLALWVSGLFLAGLAGWLSADLLGGWPAFMRMLGRFRRVGCGRFRCRLCGPGDVRQAKREEKRLVRREAEREQRER
jgi:hypothetical protein